MGRLCLLASAPRLVCLLSGWWADGHSVLTGDNGAHMKIQCGEQMSNQGRIYSVHIQQLICRGTKLRFFCVIVCTNERANSRIYRGYCEKEPSESTLRAVKYVFLQLRGPVLMLFQNCI